MACVVSQNIRRSMLGGALAVAPPVAPVEIGPRGEVELVREDRPTIGELPWPRESWDSVLASIQPSPVPSYVNRPPQTTIEPPGSPNGIGEISVWNETGNCYEPFKIRSFDWERTCADSLPRVVINGQHQSGVECTLSGYPTGTGTSSAWGVSADSLVLTMNQFYKYTATTTATYASSTWASAASSVSAWRMMDWHAGCVNNWGDEWQSAKTPKEKLKELLKARSAPLVIGCREPLKAPEDQREACARATLRRIVGEDQYRRFVTDGFVSLRVKSGLVYRIRPGADMTDVFDRGKQVDKLCVVFLGGGFPPTDSVIMRYLYLLNDEEGFRKLAIRHGFTQRSALEQRVDQRRLTEVFREMKALAA